MLGTQLFPRRLFHGKNIKRGCKLSFYSTENDIEEYILLKMEFEQLDLLQFVKGDYFIKKMTPNEILSRFIYFNSYAEDPHLFQPIIGGLIEETEIFNIQYFEKFTHILISAINFAQFEGLIVESSPYYLRVLELNPKSHCHIIGITPEHLILGKYSITKMDCKNPWRHYT